MKNKFVSLIFGLMVILIVPAVTSSCVETGERDKTEQAAFQSEVNNNFVLVQDETIENGEEVIEADSGLSGYFSLQSIINLVFLILSVAFGTLWKRAKNVLEAINDGLEDDNLTRVEIARIVNAWKGK